MSTHSSTLAWKIPWAKEPGRLQSMGSLRVGHDWVTSLSLFTFMLWRRKWQPTHAWRIPGTGEPGGLLSMGSHRVGHDWSDLAAAAAATYLSPITLELTLSHNLLFNWTPSFSILCFRRCDFFGSSSFYPHAPHPSSQHAQGSLQGSENTQWTTQEVEETGYESWF